VSSADTPSTSIVPGPVNPANARLWAANALPGRSGVFPAPTGRGRALRLMLAEPDSPPERARIVNRTDGGAPIHAHSAAS